MNRGKQGGKVLLPPINFIFKLLQQQTPVEIWLAQQDETRIEGKIRVRSCPQRRASTSGLTKSQGFDEFMNMVIDDAIEVPQATKAKPVPGPRRELGSS